MTAVACPDKFRGSLSAAGAAAAMARGLARAGFDTREVPLADGGEGTLDALMDTLGGRRRRITVTGPLGDPVEAEYGVLPDGTAVVEMARASGLALVGDANDAVSATTRGTGELVSAAVRAGARRVVVGVGGSATTDGGLGALEALQWSLRGAEVVVACDVETRFTDAAAVYGPQKGAGPKEVELLTRRLERLASDYAERAGSDVAGLPGSGAAGGLAGGLAALGARLQPGFDVVAETVGLDEALEGADLMVTGEGRLDPSSFAGKVVGGALEWAAAAGVRTRGVVVGEVAEGAQDVVPAGVEVRSLLDRAFDASDAVERVGVLVEEATLDVARSLHLNRFLARSSTLEADIRARNRDGEPG